MAEAQEPARSSKLGRFFRRIADFLDNHSNANSATLRQNSHSVFRGSRTEVDVLTFGMLAVGILVLGTVIHGWGFFSYSGIFAALFCSGAWVLFRSINWVTGAGW